MMTTRETNIGDLTPGLAPDAAPAAAKTATGAAAILALQQTAGNAALARLLRIDPLRDPVTGGPQRRSDGSLRGYKIESGYEARRFSFDGQNLTQVTIKVELKPVSALVTEAHIEGMKAQTVAGVERYYNEPNHTLPNGDRLNVNIEFVKPPTPAHLEVTVHPGKGTAANPYNHKNWFLEYDPAAPAHEIGHQVNLPDEYIDPTTVNRRDGSSPGVYNDDSLMGDFHQRDGRGRAVRDSTGRALPKPGTSLKDRHLIQIGEDIDTARRRGAAP